MPFFVDPLAATAMLLNIYNLLELQTKIHIVMRCEQYARLDRRRWVTCGVDGGGDPVKVTLVVEMDGFRIYLKCQPISVGQFDPSISLDVLKSDQAKTGCKTRRGLRHNLHRHG